MSASGEIRHFFVERSIVMDEPIDVLKHFNFSNPRQSSKNFVATMKSGWGDHDDRETKKLKDLVDDCLTRLSFHVNDQKSCGQTVYHEYAAQDIIGALQSSAHDPILQKIFVENIDNPLVSKQAESTLSNPQLHVYPDTILQLLSHPCHWKFGMTLCIKNETAGVEDVGIHDHIVIFLRDVMHNGDKIKAQEAAEIFSIFYRRVHGNIPSDVVGKAKEILSQQVENILESFKDQQFLVSKISYLARLENSASVSEEDKKKNFFDMIVGNHEVLALSRFYPDKEVPEVIKRFYKLRALLVVKAKELQEQEEAESQRLAEIILANEEEEKARKKQEARRVMESMASTKANKEEEYKRLKDLAAEAIEEFGLFL